MSWHDYFEKTKHRKLRDFYLRAFDLINVQKSDGKTVIDLGCGAGNEVQDLAEKGWQVLGIDGEDAAIERVQLIAKHYPSSVEIRKQRFEDIIALPNVDCIYSYHSLPFCDKAHFDGVLGIIAKSINLNGYFAGTFFGENDDWVRLGKCCGCTKSELETHFADFEIIHYREFEERSRPALENVAKNWHIIELIAKRQSIY